MNANHVSVIDVIKQEAEASELENYRLSKELKKLLYSSKKKPKIIKKKKKRKEK